MLSVQQLKSACVALALWNSTPAFAEGVTRYTYDALGRFVAANTTGTINNGLTVTMKYDAAGNRTQYIISGAALTFLDEKAPEYLNASSKEITHNHSPSLP